ncbi:MAG TPA: Calx-beta domain-containing protein, partial [Pyrinomonadaceae bacterium]
FNVINLAGTSAAVSNSNILVTNNQLINFAQAGLFVANSDNVTFTNNDVFQTAARTTALFGVAVNSMLGTNVFSQNTIHDLTTSLGTSGMVFGDVRATTVSRNRIYNFPSTSGSTGVLTGIQFTGVSGAPASLTVVNNMVSIIPNFTNNQSIFGIRDFGFATNVFTSYFNSTLIGGTSTGTANSWACQRGFSAPTAHTMIDNICFNNRTGGTGNHFAAGDQSVGTGTFVSNYNIFVGTGATPANFFDKAATSTPVPVNFASWQAGPPTRDANSQASNPGGNYTVANMFVSPTDLHLNISGTNPAFNAGTPVADVTTDFDGQPRDSAPDIGADEVVVAAGILSLSSSTYTVNESDGTVTITVNRAGTEGAVSVNYTLTDGTATGGAACGAGVDYVNTGGTVNFAAGQSTQTFTVQICPDALDEPNETFTVTLSGATGGAIIGSPNAATVTITDDDATPTLSINDVSQNEGTGGTTNFVFTVTLSAPSAQAVAVDYATIDGTATAPGDYAPIPPTTVVFAPGETTKQVTVSVVGDAVVEPNETFFVNLANAVNATIADNQGQGTIVNDDVQPGQLSINDVRVTEGNSGTTTATFTVTLVSGGSPNPTTVNYATANGTATAGSDYVATSGTLTFAPGETTKTITVTINGDTLKEANEFFFVNLSTPSSNAVIADGQGVGIIIDDDRAYVADFDHDRKSDYSVWRPGDGFWYTLLSDNNVATYKKFGTNGDKPVPGDYDGDGIADIAVFRPSEGIWYIQRSSDFGFVAQQWGLATDNLVQGDYDGDGKTDIAVFRNGIWFVIQSSNGNQLAVQFGTTGDIPVQGDYDGDAKTDFAVYRGGNWYVLRSSDGGFVAQQWGLATDKPIVGDFDGDGRADFTVYRDGTWYILQSLTGSFRSVSFGTATDIPTPADFDGDGTTDVAVFRPSNGYWYVLRSTDGAFVAQQWGQNGDVPIPAAYQSR